MYVENIFLHGRLCKASVVYKYNTKGKKKKKDANCSDSGRKRTNIALIFCPLLTSLP
jgi:hypothetical protein